MIERLKKISLLSVFFFFFNDEEPHQTRAIRTHPWMVNPKYTTPPARTVYQVKYMKRNEYRCAS
jgi:hypothetical protein